MSADPTPYDTFAYSGFAYLETHPSRLATMAALYGMNPAPPSRCRVLELGCGVGGNLIPMAHELPGSEFVGIDLSGRSIELGLNTIAALGLTNIALRHADIMDISAEYGRFDYIIAHGVYSWVPAAVRDKILAVFHQHLTPQGIAYVSYNAPPGSHLRNVVRDLMNFHVRGISDPKKKVGQARAVVKMVAEASAPDTVYGKVMRDQLERIDHKGDDGVFHDDLDQSAVPFLLHQVVAEAERHGLQYLSDASLSRRSLERLPESLQAMLARFDPGAYMARDQYHDFIDGHGFRRTLLCRDNVRLDRNVEPSCIKRHYLASSVTPTATGSDPEAAGIVEFKTDDGDTLETSHRLTKAALIHLGQRWPQAVSFADLLDAARKRLMVRDDVQDACSDENSETTTVALFKAMCNGNVEFYLYPPSCVTTLGERPQVSALIRKQVEIDTRITNLRHDSIELKDEIMRRFVHLVDGTRSLDQLTADFAALVAQWKPDQAGNVTRDIVEHNLKSLARLGLLAG